MGKIIAFLFLTLSLPLTSYNHAHKFYFSVTKVAYNTDEKSLQVITRIFIDDFQTALRNRYNDPSISLIEEQKSVYANDCISRYLNQKLVFTINGKETPFTFIGKEQENEFLVCYIEMPNVKSLESLEVTNQVLMDLFEEQQNIVHVKKGKVQKSFLLEQGKERGGITF